MAPARLKELKIQLQELLNLGLIRPSYSPWGVPGKMVFSKINLHLGYHQLRIRVEDILKTVFWHIVDKDGIMVDSAKIEDVRDWPTPKLATEVRSFLGLAGYDRRFLEGFPKIVVPLTELTQKNLKFVWTDWCEKSFQELNQHLITAPVLTLPLDNEKFVVYSDATR
ncbi:uncharacterized mitochondrial protein AtMg00860-like [Cannabis sativa]|uniref:uncharacterized mitochondrial protein AtMg00860-like n=1 Tax=Cannabis sativa TaxID=3483 RepID=UPI0029CA0576|nr:uncharacterized mitochondrial protein AtMg00860-like [Cannabis sativa]